MNEFCISQDSRPTVTFIRSGGQVHSHLCQIYPEFHVPKLLKSIHFDSVIREIIEWLIWTTKYNTNVWTKRSIWRQSVMFLL